ncbi:peptidoglycan editing factor PgeF [Bacillus sp. Marseille-P3800]|uniref:peptidoglycan editing factor PgeF n=1 Tax=Bacillus sp. Marseille-P3800 TaxID=2014782 RepID=UPI000C076B51|nr:peptidoglycan editing factor PgeF [Bacillus sp. Marseille-P3800]
MKANWQLLTERVEYETNFNSLDQGLFAGFTTRHGGVSNSPYDSLNMGFHVEDSADAVVHNRERVAHDIGFALDAWIGSEQVHHATIAEVTEHDRGKGARQLDTAVQGTDGLYTSDPNVLLTSLYADCVPLYFFSKKSKMIGLCHAGWKGTVAEIGPKLVKIWVQEHAVDPHDIYVLIGPCISKQAYEVDHHVMEQVKTLLPGDNMNIFTPTQNQRYLLDLPALNRLLLERAGILPEHLIESDRCTYGEERYFSHRQAEGKTGRMMSMIGLKKVKET